MTQTMKRAWLLAPKTWRCPECGGKGLTGNMGLILLMAGTPSLPANNQTRVMAMRQPLGCDCGWQGRVNDVAQLSKPRRKEA